MIFGPLIMILVLALMIAPVVLLVRLGGRAMAGDAAAPRAAGPHTARLLKERYARGEIDREEYVRRRADLQD